MGIFKSKPFSTPTICIGNLSVGGTGKTPMVEFLISILKKDFKIAVLSRGYRRKSRGFLLADFDTTVEALGDEPYQIHLKFPEVTVAVDADRRNGISILEHKICPDLILLDDAFQHRKVKPGFSILLTAYGNLYTDDWYLPTGNLRDGIREAKRADLIVVTKCPVKLSEQDRNSVIKKLGPQPGQQVLFSHLRYGPSIRGMKITNSLQEFKNKKITLVTGVANPRPLVEHLKNEGLVFEHLKFKDHHFFSENDLEQLRKKECILTTEKDYVRLKDQLENLYYIAVRHQFSDTDKAILEGRINGFMKSNS